MYVIQLYMQYSSLYIMMYILYLQMISYVGENIPTSYDQMGKYVSVPSQTLAL